MRMPAALAATLLLLPGGAGAGDPAAEYAAQAAKLGAKDAKAWLALADFAEERLLWREREEALRKAEARERLDEARFAGAWIPADEAEAKEAAAMGAKGLSFYGAQWIPAADADRQRAADRKTQGWDLDLRLDTPHLCVYSNRALAPSRKAAAVLENAYAASLRVLGRIWKPEAPAKPLRVYLLSDFAATAAAAQARGVPAPNGQPCFYRPEVDLLFVGAEPRLEAAGDGERLMAAVGETAAAVRIRLARKEALPPWLRAGLPGCFRLALRGRQVLPGALGLPADLGGKARDGILKALEEGAKDASPAALAAMDAAAFDPETDSEGRNRALAGALVHFLLHAEGGRHAARLRSGDLKGLEEPFRRHLLQVLVPALKVK